LKAALLLGGQLLGGQLLDSGYLQVDDSSSQPNASVSI
jgi:hypothetical protein